MYELERVIALGLLGLTFGMGQSYAIDDKYSWR